MTLTATDLFCGAGGSSLGATHAGIELRMAANHWPKAIDVHQANFPDAGHDCADISQVDPRRYPRTDILMASPECTNHSSAKGVSRRRQDPNLFDSADLGAERSRATMWDVHRFHEEHRYEACIIENVVDVVRWPYFRSWCLGWEDAGYDLHMVSLNSAHTGHVPQWRDRAYFVGVPKGLRIDLALRPPCWCDGCERIVEGVQSFKVPGRRLGKWRSQYHYRCPECAEVVAPPAPPVAPAIDWHIRGTRIGDRSKALAEKSRARVQRALDLYGPSLVAIAGHTYERPGYTRAWPLDGPAPVQTTTIQHGLVVPFRNHTLPSTTEMPVATVSAGGNHHGLIFAPQSGGEGKPTVNPAPALTAKVPPFLVTYTRTGEARPVTEPATACTTKTRHAVVRPSLEVDDCELRSVTCDEQGRFMAFPDSYAVEGTQAERTKLYGNAVTPPAMQLLAGRVADALAA